MKTKLLITLLLCAIGAGSAQAQTQMWGTTQAGGTSGDGVIFTMDGNGANYHVEYSFDNPTGSLPVGNVVLADNGKLYGVTEEGGFGDSCVIYSYQPLTGIYTNIYDLYQYTQYGWGAESGMLNASNGMLYGLCRIGGAGNSGVIYKIDPATDTYTDIYDFDNFNGFGPVGSLIQLSNGKLYGMTSYGGANSKGVIFSFDPVTSVFVNLYDFIQSTGGVPFGDLMQASNSKLYGMTYEGGSNGYGVLFSFDIATGAYIALHNFDLTHGGNPLGNVMQASNGLLYGMTNHGGASNFGVLFSFDITTNIFTDLLEFDNVATGANPARSLSQAGNGKLYGTTLYGGVNSSGVAFSYDIATNTYTKLMDFGSMGAYPNCNLVETPVLTPTGIPAIVAATETAVYPNPASGSLTVTGTAKDEMIQFIDVAGKEIFSLKISAGNKSDVNISRFPNVFFIKRQNGEVRKIVKQ